MNKIKIGITLAVLAMLLAVNVMRVTDVRQNPGTPQKTQVANVEASVKIDKPAPPKKGAVSFTDEVKMP